MSAAQGADATSIRIVPMEVLVLGFCRTGTACALKLKTHRYVPLRMAGLIDVPAMRAALSVLGYGDAHHIGRVMANPAEMDSWTAAINAKFRDEGTPYGQKEWDALLGEFKVVADVPGILFASELIQAYPQAKVILTTRDPAQWWKSFRDTLLVMLDMRSTAFARWLDPSGFGKFVPFARRNLEIFLGPLDRIDEKWAKCRYVEYNASIRALVPSERLLEYEMGEGWRRLCRFLEKDVPEVPFPHKNDSTMILEGSRKQIWRIYRRATLRMLGTLAVVIAVGLGIHLGRI